MRKVVILAVICVVAGLVAPPSRASCGDAVPMKNFNGYPIFNCPDGKPVKAYAFQPGAPTPVNTGLLDIVCENDPQGDLQCNSLIGNVPGDKAVYISTDWGNAGINGCPSGRVVVNVQCNDGSGTLLSLEGTCFVFGYNPEAALHYDSGTGIINLDVGAASGQQNGRPKTNNFTRTGGMDVFDVQVDAPVLQSDCTPGSYGQFIQSLYPTYCPYNCAGIVPPSRGKLYTSTQPCTNTDSRPPTDARATGWTLQTLDAAGHAMISLPTPLTGMCNFLGTSTIIGGNESDVITGFVSSAGPNAASPVAEAVRAARKGNSVEVTFRTSSELGLAGFNIYAAGKAKGEIKLNAGLIAPTGGGGGASYTETYAVPDFKGNRSVIVESVLTDNTTLRAPKADF